MKIQETPLNGVIVLEAEPIEDFRGHFARIWDRDALLGLEADWVQGNLGFSHLEGTIRGFHYQREPHREAKLVSCSAGKVFDVAVDLRGESPTYLQWFGIELSPENRLSLYLPPGCAHGYQTLADNSVLHYLTSHRYVAEASTGVRWNDPEIGLNWPLPGTNISEQDQSWPLLEGVVRP